MMMAVSTLRTGIYRSSFKLVRISEWNSAAPSKTSSQTENLLPNKGRDGRRYFHHGIIDGRCLSAAKLNSAQSEEGLQISDACTKRLKQIASAEYPYLRVCVEGGGCSGFQYKFDLDKSVNTDDRIFERNGSKVIVDETSLEYLKGATVDYQEELIRSAFRIISNPKAEQGCSCGASFSIKID